MSYASKQCGSTDELNDFLASLKDGQFVSMTTNISTGRNVHTVVYKESVIAANDAEKLMADYLTDERTASILSVIDSYKREGKNVLQLGLMTGMCSDLYSALQKRDFDLPAFLRIPNVAKIRERIVDIRFTDIFSVRFGDGFVLELVLRDESIDGYANGQIKGDTWA